MKDISTYQFLKEYREIFNSFNTHKQGGEHFGVSRQHAKAVYDANSIPGPGILKVMDLKPVKEINYRYERV